MHFSRHEKTQRTLGIEGQRELLTNGHCFFWCCVWSFEGLNLIILWRAWVFCAASARATAGSSSRRFVYPQLIFTIKRESLTEGVSSLFLFSFSLSLSVSVPEDSQSVGVSQSLVPASLLEHLSVGQAVNRPPQGTTFTACSHRICGSRQGTGQSLRTPAHAAEHGDDSGASALRHNADDSLPFAWLASVGVATRHTRAVRKKGSNCFFF